MYGVCDDYLEAIDCFATASILASAIKKIGAVDLVLCGEGSGDFYSQQVGPILGHLLGYANLNAIAVSFRGKAGGFGFFAWLVAMADQDDRSA